jgi:glucosamine 6-phosphate synthetase-like amidotransferase/phosphosugar isomerase protein
LLFNEERGREASGIAVMKRDGTYDSFKAPLAAAELVKTPEYLRVLRGIGPQATVVLGHTRYPTQGAPENNANNHPLRAQDVWGVHNGHITNDAVLTADYGLVREAEVDSEVIFQLITQIDPRQPADAYMKEMYEHIAKLEGRFVFLSVDVRKPDRLLVAKYKNPLCLHYHARWQALIFSSRYIFLRKAFGSAVIAESLDANHLFLFDAKCPIKPQGKEKWSMQTDNIKVHRPFS